MKRFEPRNVSASVLCSALSPVTGRGRVCGRGPASDDERRVRGAWITQVAQGVGADGYIKLIQ